MFTTLRSLLDWSEVWALLMPFAALYLQRRQPPALKPVIWYAVLAFAINLGIDLNIPFKNYYPSWLQSNNPLYNVHSITRFVCFSIYFVRLPEMKYKGMVRLLSNLSFVFLLVNFTFFEKFYNYNSFSSNLFTAEAFVLLVYCMLYYLSELQDDDRNLFRTPHFWVVTGLSIYVVTNFFVFLFYEPMIELDVELALNIWNLHNISFIVFCLFIAKAFYGAPRYQLAG
ncbi:MAG TPA: hypothetical protein VLL95_10280 [Phnomibacter sp.]|nr:hypothetical protein [Phnomibacter sp.]